MGRRKEHLPLPALPGHPALARGAEESPYIAGSLCAVKGFSFPRIIASCSHSFFLFLLIPFFKGSTLGFATGPGLVPTPHIGEKDGPFLSASGLSKITPSLPFSLLFSPAPQGRRLNIWILDFFFFFK